MDTQVLRAIIKTLCYGEIFSYPLTFSELHKYLISRKKVSKRELLYTLQKYSDFFEEEKGFLVLKNGKMHIKTRIKRMQESRKKLAKALWISHILSFIPTIKLISLSGSLAMYNAKKEDDIDLFIITKKNSLWLTRGIVLLILFLLKEKRGRNSAFFQNKICPNMFLAEDALQIEKQKRNMYTAHELAQIKVLYLKDNMYEKFLAENKWVMRFLPHAFLAKKIEQKSIKSNLFIQVCNEVSFLAQKIYMRGKITYETVEKNRAFFHPVQLKHPISRLYTLKVDQRLLVLERRLREHVPFKITSVN